MQRISGGELSHLSETEVATLLDRAYNRDEYGLDDTRLYDAFFDASGSRSVPRNAMRFSKHGKNL